MRNKNKYTFNQINQYGSGFCIIPAILDQSFDELRDKIDRARGKTSRLGIDIIDGIYADNITIAVADLERLDLSDFEIEVQLMTEYPGELLGACHTAKVSRVYGHIERMGSLNQFLDEATELKLEAGLALDLHTPTESLSDEHLDRIPGVLLMAVKAGFSGQEFNPLVLDKISQLRDRGFQGDIQIDGNVTDQTIADCVRAGANHFSVTSYMWQHRDISEAIDKLTQVAKNLD